MERLDEDDPFEEPSRIPPRLPRMRGHFKAPNPEYNEEMSEQNQMIEAQLGFFGHTMVMFSSIGFGLYIASKIFGVDFERFLGMVLLGGLGLLAARPKYNPQFSSFIEHGMSEAELETIRTFAKRRLDLQNAPGDQRDAFLGKFKNASYSQIERAAQEYNFVESQRNPFSAPYYDDGDDDDLFS